MASPPAPQRRWREEVPGPQRGKRAVDKPGVRPVLMDVGTLGRGPGEQSESHPVGHREQRGGVGSHLPPFHRSKPQSWLNRVRFTRDLCPHGTKAATPRSQPAGSLLAPPASCPGRTPQ